MYIGYFIFRHDRNHCQEIVLGDPVSGWPSMMSIFSFIGGMQLLCLGIIGQYLAKTYLETKNRPLYLIKEFNLKE